MILSDFLSQQNNDDSNPNEIIPILFDMYKILENNLEKFCGDRYLIQMQSHTKSSGIKILILRPEKQHNVPKQGHLQRPHIGQGKAGSKRKRPDPINQVINKPSNLSQEIPGRTKIVTGKTNSGHTTNNVNDGMINNNPFIPDVPFHPDPLLRQPIKWNTTRKQNSQNEQNISPDVNFDFEENSPFQEGIMSKTFQRPDKSFFQNPTELGDLINKGNFNLKYLPKQTDIDKILEVIQRKVLKGTPFACGS